MMTLASTETPLTTARRIQADIDRQLAAASRRLEEISTQRRPLVWAAQTGDADARRDLDRLAEEVNQLDRSTEELTLASDEARTRVASAEQAEQDAELDRQLAIARKIEIELLDHAAKFDEGLAVSCRALRAIEGLRMKLARTGALDAPYLNRLTGRAFVQHALANSGLSEFIDHAGAAGRKSLYDAAKTSLSAIRRPDISRTTDAA